MLLESQEMQVQEIPKLIQPRDHRAKVCVWADLTVDDVDRISESLNSDHVRQVLADIFHLDDFRTNIKTGIVMDLYFYTIMFARENNFNREKMSAVFSIVKKTHEVCIETPFGNVDQTFNYFKELVLCHAVNRPPHSIELFNADEVRKITEYTVNTYFRHFKMYKYAFTPLVRLDLSLSYVGLPVTPPPSEVDDDGDEDIILYTANGSADETSPQENEVPPEQTTEPTEGETITEQQKTPEPEESQSRKELRTMIQTYLSDEIKKMKTSVEEQIKSTEDSLNKKLEVTEGTKSGKGGRGSPKGKKK
ncbi:cilia- and flagella-associated protein 119-like isoform X1 [Mytilus californianus]|uniref:cilia- and flagella-associated protein 119-like isoform X1 n=1 Tax=Mytilus californianus TaxID=6549 RepID=UPI0022465E26|nr:cilia- and flagella-associated protein 119-like isoform X1 [Mytilus californianus]